MNINALSSLAFKRSHLALLEGNLSQNMPSSLESELEISNDGRVASSDKPQPVLRYADYLRQKGISNVIYHSFNDMSKEKSRMLDNTEKIKVCDLARLAKKFTEPSVDTSYISLFSQDMKKFPECYKFDNEKSPEKEYFGVLPACSEGALSVSSKLCHNHMLHSVVNLHPKNNNSNNWDDDKQKSAVTNHTDRNIDLVKQITIKALENSGYEPKDKLEPESIVNQINSLIGEEDWRFSELDDFPTFNDEQNWGGLSDDAFWAKD